jgi:hypothetical protein
MLVFLVSAKPNSRRPPLLPLATARRLAASYKVPYTLPSSVSSNPFVCRSYKNCRRVYGFFPFWNASTPESGPPCPPISDQSPPPSCSCAGNGARVAVHESRSSAFLCFHALTNCKFCNSFVFTFLHLVGGWRGLMRFDVGTFRPSDVPTCQRSAPVVHSTYLHRKRTRP